MFVPQSRAKNSSMTSFWFSPLSCPKKELGLAYHNSTQAGLSLSLFSPSFIKSFLPWVATVAEDNSNEDIWNTDDEKHDAIDVTDMLWIIQYANAWVDMSQDGVTHTDRTMSM